jgi:multicomponent Na+:H+ antiporter subunit D
MNSNIIILPVALQLLVSIFLLLAWGKVRPQKIISVFGSALGVLLAIYLFYQVYAGGTMVMQAGNWKAPFGISFVADLFAITLVLLSSLSGFAVSLFSTAGIGPSRIKFGFFPVLHFLLMGLNGAFLAGDIFNLYVWFEIIIIASFVLLTIGSERIQLKGATNYVVTNLIASVIFLTGIAVLYGLTGSLNMADLSIKMGEVENRVLVQITGIFFFIAFGIKSAIFPLYFWLPSSYHTPPSSVAAIFGGLLTKVGVYALLRVFTLIFEMDAFWQPLFMWVAVLTLLIGGLGALVQVQLRKLLSFIIVCHIGFMIAGLALHNEGGLTGAVFYLIHDILVKTNIFLVAGVIYLFAGTFDLKKAGGLYAERPIFAIIAFLVMFSLVGIPPLSGFWPKLYLIIAAWDKGFYVLLGAILIASFLTLIVFGKIWSEVFWKSKPEDNPGPVPSRLEIWKSSGGRALIAPILFLLVFSLYVGLGAEHIIKVADRITYELMHPELYVQKVLNP